MTINSVRPTRCAWLDCTKADYVKYHDEEWAVPVYDDHTLFEFIILESAQAGLNWYTILKRRNGYRQAFANFDVNQVAQFDNAKVEQLMQNEAIIRHRAKIKAAITNAQAFIAIQQQFGSFSQYIWDFVGNKPIMNQVDDTTVAPATSALSDKISADLKQRGFTFFGSTICYAYLQACGLINSHSKQCFLHPSHINERRIT
ncbi:DNA-3-methyladenine glycosylase I [Rheinheimera sp. WS51]|uniref:DNA-3-methyladenine glycosylase I n=1 Tax=Rheinheimera sp. WS51 TaxID=3425886 RepID=UPI003D8CA0DB